LLSYDTDYAMAHPFREPERRQAFLLPADMMDWLSEGDIVHLIVDAVAMMDLRAWFRSGLHAKRGILWLARLWPLSV